MILPTVLCLTAALSADNLLSNPSFEEIAPDGRPAHWSPFVMQQAGAFAEADPLAHDGSRAAMLHVPNRYEREPANNWSQVVLADVADQTLLLTGMIRTEGVGEAALWLQCFSREPARVVAAATSSDTTLLAGTNDWTPVTIRLAAPAETEFVVVRCVIKGRGSAWFDSLSLGFETTDAPELPAFEPENPPVGITAAPDDAAPQPQEADLLELSRMLNQAIAELEANNAQILERVQQIQKELNATRANTQEAVPLESSEVRHPLVPRGWKPGGE